MPFPPVASGVSSRCSAFWLGMRAPRPPPLTACRHLLGGWHHRGRARGNVASSPLQLHHSAAGCNGSVPSRDVPGPSDHRRSISANLAWNTRSGQITGTFTGSLVGTARLTGRQAGAGFDLTIE
jgi:hypothetical protein